MLKLTGAILLTAGCFGMGWCICMDLDRRIRQLRLMARAFAMLGSEVGYSRAELSEGLIRVGARLKNGKDSALLGACLEQIGKRVRSDEGETLSHAWQWGMEAYLGKTCLGREEKRLLLSFPEHTGFPDGKMQLILLEQFAGLLSEAEEDMRRRAEGRKRTVLSVSTAVGVLLVILLI